MADRAIEVQGLVREYKKGPRAVDGIDLYVDSGEIYGFLGPNGAGKSTTVKMLVTLLPPSGGRATVGGFDIAREGAEVRRVIGAALQDASLDPLLTATEHFTLQAGLHGLSAETAQARATELLERVALSGAANRKVQTYSGGMKRRLDLALSLVHAPRIVFLDEPTTGLDPQSRAALWEEVQRLARDEGVTVFLTTQYLEEADMLADRIGIIDHGTIVAEGTPATLKAEIGRPTVEVLPERPEDQPRVEQILARFGESVRAGAPNAAAVRLREQTPPLAEMVRLLDGAGIPIADLTLHAPTLDDVFLAKTGRPLEEVAEAAEPERSPEVELREALAGRSAIERLPTGILRDWQAGRHLASAHAGPRVIVVREGPRAGERFRIDGRAIIGREGTDLVIDDPEISRRHAAFHLIDGSLVVEDLRSLNGTWVNGRRITSTTLLDHGDVVTIGKTVLEISAETTA